MILCILLVFPVIEYTNYNSTITVEAHSGRTDSAGGHKDNKNKSGLGSYHYHCGGNPPHLHDSGTCPYSSGGNGEKSKSTSSSKTSTNHSTTTSSSKSLVKKVQQALNDKGYDCGTPDGIMGSKTKKALKTFQKDNGLEVDGVIGKQVEEALNIS